MDKLVSVGISESDITPDHPIRLSGYGARREETCSTISSLYARALAIGSKRPVLLLALDNCGVSGTITEKVTKELEIRTGLKQEQIVVCFTHTHNGPMLSGVAPLLFSTDLPLDHKKNIECYTEKVIESLIDVGIKALANRQASRLTYFEGHAGFAVNRRSQIGPVDHVMPMLRVEDSKGNLKAVWISYACHCTTLGPSDNFICSDWAGFAVEIIKKNHPGVSAFVSIGCAGNANPFPRTGLSHARRHGADIAREVDRLLCTSGRILPHNPHSFLNHTLLPYDDMPSKKEWLAKANEEGPIGYHARYWLAHLQSGQKLPKSLRYPIQTWVFGDNLVILFLAGEVVADYARILRKIYDPDRLWIGAYANDLPGYIPSRRVWKEGGYEGGDATVYFGLPNRFTIEVEDYIINGVSQVIPDTFKRSQNHL